MKPANEIVAHPHVRCTVRDETGLAFRIVNGKHTLLYCIASWGFDWDHVSVRSEHRCPDWYEMDLVRCICFREDETVMQLHVPTADLVNVHPNVLHLWRPQRESIPRPPKWMV